MLVGQNVPIHTSEDWRMMLRIIEFKLLQTRTEHGDITFKVKMQEMLKWTLLQWLETAILSQDRRIEGKWGVWESLSLWGPGSNINWDKPPHEMCVGCLRLFEWEHLRKKKKQYVIDGTEHNVSSVSRHIKVSGRKGSQVTFTVNSLPLQPLCLSLSSVKKTHPHFFFLNGQIPICVVNKPQTTGLGLDHTRNSSWTQEDDEWRHWNT